MNFIKNLFHRITDLIAKGIATAVTKILIWTSPVSAAWSGKLDSARLTTRHYFQFFLGVTAGFMLIAFFNMCTIALLTVFTTFFAFVLPLLIANILACGLICFYIVVVVTRASDMLPEQITFAL